MPNLKIGKREKAPIIIGNRTCWRCPSCKQWLRECDFYGDSKSPNGLKSHCKKCHTKISIATRDEINKRRLNREHMRRARKSDPEKFKRIHREANRKRPKGTPADAARSKLRTEVRAGRIEQPSRCSECNRRHKVVAHHEDYTKPLEVEWLCYECHGRRHWKS